MDAQQFERIRALFDLVVDLPAEEQAAAVLAGSDDPLVRAEVLGMLGLQDVRTPLDTITQGAGGVVRLLADAVDEVPERLGRFRVVRELGRGGMGVVYEAEQELPRRRVALKTLPSWNRTTGATERFRGEVEALARVLHPGVPQVYEVFEVDGAPVLSMELVEGVPLLEAADARSLRQRVRLLCDIAEAVQHAHERGVIHRDLKPGNVRVTASGQPKVLDFGIAALAGSVADAGGTLAYMAPEQLEGGQADARVDVYGLAATGWHLCTGRPPILVQGRGRAEVLAAKQVLPSGTLPTPLQAVLHKALSVDPDVRYATADAFREDLRRFLTSRRVVALEGSWQAWVVAASRRYRPHVALGVVLAGVAMLLALWLEQHNERREQARREGVAEVAMAGLLASTERLGADHPAVADAFRAFVDDPQTQGTAAVARAHLWRAGHVDDRTARQELLFASWTLAPDADSEEEAARALAVSLAESAHWEAVAGLLERIDPDALVELRFRSALAHWDIDGARPYAPEGAGLILDRLAHMQPRPDVVAPDDDTLWIDPATGFGKVGEEVYTVVDGGVRRVEVFEDRVSAMAFGDLDGDGVLERYTTRFRATDVGRAEPPEAASAWVPGAAAESSYPQFLETLPGGLVVAGRGWRNNSLRVLAPTDDGWRLAGRLRTSTQALTTYRDPDGVERLAMCALPPETPPFPQWRGDVRLGSFRFVTAAWTGDAVVQSEPVHVLGRCGFLRAADLDGDGLDDLVLNAFYDYGAPELHLLRQLPDGGFVDVPVVHLRYEPELAPDLLFEDDAGAWWAFGGPEDPALPRRTVEPVAPEPAPPFLTVTDTEIWRRADAIAALGRPALAARELEQLATRYGADGWPILARAFALRQRVGETPPALPVARRLASALPDGVAAPKGLVAVLTEGHEAAALRELGGTRPWLEELTGIVEVLHEEGTSLHEAWQVPAPEAVRYDPVDHVLRVDALAGRGALLEVPLDRVGDAIEADILLDLEEMDWAAGIQLTLVAGDTYATAALHKRGGGPFHEQAHALMCRGTFAEQDYGRGTPPQSGVRRLRLSWVRGPGEVGHLSCGIDEDLVVARKTALEPGPATLVISAAPAHAGLALGSARIASVTVRGARPVAGAPDPGRAFVTGERTAADAFARDPDPLRRLLAVPERPAGGFAADLRALDDSDLAFLLRTDSARWLSRARDARPDAVARWWDVWRIPVRYGNPTASPAILDAALANLDLDTAVGRTVARRRAEQLLDAGRAPEAARTLEALSVRTDVPDVHRLSAELLLAEGDAAGAREALARWLAVHEDVAAAQDQAMDDPRLSQLLGADAALPVVIR